MKIKEKQRSCNVGLFEMVLLCHVKRFSCEWFLLRL